MSSLQDTPQQALAGWLRQRGGEKAIQKMADDLDIDETTIALLMDVSSFAGDLAGLARAVSIAVYTGGVVVFPACPDWVAEEVRASGWSKSAGLSFATRLMADKIGQYQAFERSWLFKLWRLFRG